MKGVDYLQRTSLVFAIVLTLRAPPSIHMEML